MKLKSEIKTVKGGINAPKGFKSVGMHIGLKKSKKDLAVIFSETPAIAAAVYTTNTVKAAPILWCQKLTENKSKIRAIVVNSGNANACTGSHGYLHTEITAEAAAKFLGVQPNEVLVASTGVIGVPLPIETILSGLKKACPLISSGEQGALDAATAIMTTDTFPKEIAVEFEIDGKPVRIAGIAKGSGMIHPNMATMLAFITTDADITENMLELALSETVADTYNMISVDGDTSTNDMVAVLANSEADNTLIDKEDEKYFLFRDALYIVNRHLAQQIIKDGEGASKFLEVAVNGAVSQPDARLIAKSVISSSLVKTAFFGEDANWGRILCAMGYSGGYFDQSKTNITFESSAGTITLMRDGLPIKFDEVQAKKILKENEIRILINLADGDSQATAWGCDLSYEYVKINGEYRT